MRKLPNVVKSIVETSLSLFHGTFREVPSWATSEEDFTSMLSQGGEEEVDEGEMKLREASAASLDRIARAMGGKMVWPLFFAAAAPMLAAPDWRARAAGMLGLAQVTEGCRRMLAPRVRDIVTSVLPFTADVHPRVRHAALRACGQLLLDFQDPEGAAGGGELGEASTAARGGEEGGGSSAAARARGAGRVRSIMEVSGEAMLSVLVEAMGAKNAEVPRVRSMAVASLLNLTDPNFCPKDLLTSKGMVKPTLGALFDILRDVPSPKTREAAMVVVGHVSEGRMVAGWQ